MLSFGSCEVSFLAKDTHLRCLVHLHRCHDIIIFCLTLQLFHVSFAGLHLYQSHIQLTHAAIQGWKLIIQELDWILEVCNTSSTLFWFLFELQVGGCLSLPVGGAGAGAGVWVLDSLIVCSEIGSVVS